MYGAVSFGASLAASWKCGIASANLPSFRRATPAFIASSAAELSWLAFASIPESAPLGWLGVAEGELPPPSANGFGPGILPCGGVGDGSESREGVDGLVGPGSDGIMLLSGLDPGAA